MDRHRVLGLVIAFVAVRVELEDDAPIGGTRDAAVYGAMLRERERMDGAERAAKETEKTSNLRTTFLAKVVGAAFVLVGFGEFFCSNCLGDTSTGTTSFSCHRKSRHQGRSWLRGVRGSPTT